jgi:hypothetical protein
MLMTGDANPVYTPLRREDVDLGGGKCCSGVKEPAFANSYGKTMQISPRLGKKPDKNYPGES